MAVAADLVKGNHWLRALETRVTIQCTEKTIVLTFEPADKDPYVVTMSPTLVLPIDLAPGIDSVTLAVDVRALI